ncbi:carboxypeptidase regulatory-like domain-containing protein [Candidatus Parabeggiatoa sp. HSG14]|uniref:carboxypeptidase regulatory-like domain-containing protein n=1 Tax=Candidatus Parabeggiatoa sp. HSG14 TaxID=3055593 RepID=UPI0025A82BD1|nr:carboxypeptidase regulatory-like domain-containing protein [Thiotrichales bacterium HSG14]
MMKYLLVALFTITLALVGCNDDDDSSSPPKISGWGTPPPVVTPTTTDEAKEMLNLSAQVSDEFMSNLRTLRETMDADLAIQQAIDDLKNNPDVVAVTYQYKSLYIYTRLGDKIVILLDGEYRNKPDANTTSLSTFGSNATSKRLGSKSKNDNFLKALNTFTTQSVSPDGNKKALILSGFQRSFGEDLCPLKSALETGGFSVDFLVDIAMCGEPATTFDKGIISYVNSLHEYDVIYFNTHGGTDSLNLGIPYDSDNPPPELLKFNLNPGVNFSGSNKKLMISSDYISHAFKDANKFKNAMVFTDSCLGGKVKSHLADAFLDSGAAIYVGYDNTTRYNRQMPQFSSPFFQRVNQVGTSVVKALKELPKLPVYWTKTEEQDCTRFLFGCQTVETEAVKVKIYRSQTVKDDPEGFILVPFAYVIASISPNPIRAGDTLTIQGRNFSTESHQGVYLYHREIALVEQLQVVSFTDTQITANIPRSVAPKSYELYIGDYILTEASHSGYPLTVLEATLENPGNVDGLVEDALTGNPLSGATVKVFHQGNLIRDERTGTDGHYGFVLSEDDYILEISLADYIPATLYIDVTRNETTTVTSLRQVPNTSSGNGIATGKLLDAFNGQEVSNATLNIRSGINVGTSGTIVATTTTDSNGNYSVDLPGGNYTIEAIINGYTSTYFPIVCIGNHTADNQNASITPTINVGEIRFVLTWGVQPSDLDSHLLTPNIGGNRYHIFYPSGSRGRKSSAPYVQLDTDDRSSYGPETITIYQSHSGVYHYYIHNYSGSPAMTTSGAKIEIHSATGLVKSYNIPLSGTGRYWNVFSYDGSTGIITTIDQITSARRLE